MTYSLSYVYVHFLTPPPPWRWRRQSPPKRWYPTQPRKPLTEPSSSWKPHVSLLWCLCRLWCCNGVGSAHREGCAAPRAADGVAPDHSEVRVPWRVRTSWVRQVPERVPTVRWLRARGQRLLPGDATQWQKFWPSQQTALWHVTCARVLFDSGFFYTNFFCLFTTASRPALGPTQPPIQWVPGAWSWPLTFIHTQAKNEWNYTSILPQAFIAWCLVQRRGTSSWHCT
jgi:hypothetical protein